MRITFFRSLSLIIATGSLAAGSIIYALSTGTLVQAAALLSPPPSLVNGPASGPPHPTAQTQNLTLNSVPTDFLDHSIPAGYGLIKGRVINDNTGAGLENARISIPEMNIATTSDGNGNFAFDPIKVDSDNSLVTLVARVPGYGEHTMINVGVFSQDAATVLLTLKKGSAPTRYFGGLPRYGKSARYSQADLPLSTFSTAPGSLGPNPPSPLSFTSTATPPLYIRIGMQAVDKHGADTGGGLIRIDTVDFDFYMRHVLGVEWGPPSLFALDALKAGALAVKNYGWYHVLHPKTVAGQTGYDCTNSTDCQVYDPYISYTESDNAVNIMSTQGWYQIKNGLPNIFESSYVAGTQGDFIGCYNVNNNPKWTPDCMTQWGSEYWAEQGKDYKWILNNYYGPSATGGATLSYFAYAPRWPMTYVSAAGTNCITLTYSSPSSTLYAIYRYDNNSTWVLKTITSNTSWTDSSATTIGSKTYAYGVDAYGGGAWSPSTFNYGWVVGTPKVASSPPSPTTTAFFIATSTIEIRAHTSATSVTEYIVDKWNPTSSVWVSVYDGLPPVVQNDGADHTTSTVALPIAFIDDTQYPTGSGDFVYRDTTSVMPSVTSSYTISYHSYAWSDWSNYNGSIEVKPAAPY